MKVNTSIPLEKSWRTNNEHEYSKLKEQLLDEEINVQDPTIYITKGNIPWQNLMYILFILL